MPETYRHSSGKQLAGEYMHENVYTPPSNLKLFLIKMSDTYMYT